MSEGQLPRRPPTANPRPGGIWYFVGDDSVYLRWLKEHPKGFVVNEAEGFDRIHLTLHRSWCDSINFLDRDDCEWTNTTIRVQDIVDTCRETVRIHFAVQ